MILTTKSKYAVMAIVEVASNDLQKPISLTTISQRNNISLNYLEQIFLQLKKSEIVLSVKGPGGGYMLKNDPSEISIETIIDAMGENLKMTRCATDKNCRQQGVQCKTHNLWKGFGKHIRQYFASISIADVINGKVVI